MVTHPILRWGCLLVAAAILPGCSSFQDDFDAAAASLPPPGAVEGAWTGTWRSDAGDHGGELNAIVTRTAQDEFHVRYKASYKMLWTMTSEYETNLKGHFSGSTFHFEGDADLGWLSGGRYRYAGYATDDEFFSTYKSDDRGGVYELHRPTVRAAPEPPAPAPAPAPPQSPPDTAPAASEPAPAPAANPK